MKWVLYFSMFFWLLISGCNKNQPEKNVNHLNESNLSFTIKGSLITFEYQNGNTICGLIKEDRGSTGNNMFNFYGYTINKKTKLTGDDVAPMHIMNSTLGANHGQPISRAQISKHGKSNKDIGTGWSDENGRVFYIIRIHSTNEIDFLSENLGAKSNFSFAKLSTGVLRNDDQCLIVKKVSATQLYPSIKNLDIKVTNHINEEISSDGEFEADFVDITESYDIINTDDILENIKSRKGLDGEPIIEGNSMITVQNTYRFLPNMTVLISSNIHTNQEIKFSDFMFAQSIRLDKSAYYIPNSINNINGFNFTRPVEVKWSKDISSIFCNQSVSANKQVPINRIVQYSGNVGFALGYLYDPEIGNNLDGTVNTFEIRNNTGKIYPHIYDSNVQGDFLESDREFSSVMYRAFIDKSTAKLGRMSFYNFSYGNAEYVYIDYNGSVTEDIIEIQSDLELEDKKITVIESSNAQILNDVYKGNIQVKASYVPDETCYIVLKIS